MPRPALGLIETSGIDGAIVATRAASGAGQVVIVSAERRECERMTVKIEGEWTAVQAAVEAGARAADASGQFLSMHVIPHTDDSVSPILPYPRFVDRYRPGDQTVVKDKTRKAPKAPAASKPTVPTRTKPQAAARPTPRAVAPPPVVAPPPAVAQPPVVGDREIPGATSAVARSEPDWAELQAMAVVKLRKYARSVEGLPIKGREISKANKQQLLDLIGAIRGVQA
jgi:microcompartment protein CcmL/EutN